MLRVVVADGARHNNPLNPQIKLDKILGQAIALFEQLTSSDLQQAPLSNGIQQLGVRY
jgi:hypothetical protein